MGILGSIRKRNAPLESSCAPVIGRERPEYQKNEPKAFSQNDLTAGHLICPVIPGVPTEKNDAKTSPALPPAIPCLICECPAIWISVYDRADDITLADPASWKCCDCDPPPAWSLVGARLLLVGDPDLAGEQWEVFGRGPATASRGPAPRPRETSPTALADPHDPTDTYRGPQPSWHRWDAFREWIERGTLSPFQRSGNRPGRVTPKPPDQILAAPPIRCPRCQRGRVLRELRVITGGACWACHVGDQSRNEIDEL